MDGNGRWAKARGLSRLQGHREGAESVRVLARTCFDLGLKAVTLYAFSTENWGRPRTEVGGLMELLKRFLKSEEAEFVEKGIRLTTIGQTDRLPKGVRRSLERFMAKTASGRNLICNLALSYGSRDEIVQAARAVARKCAKGELDPAAIDEESFAAQLQTAHLPPLDLIIRTSGESRLSNFLLWQAAYAELIFTPTLWPDFRERELIDALVEYQRRERRFGLTPDTPPTEPPV
jgi:undecaprenyl diphosphate synthase